MARKNTCRATEIKRRLQSPLITYEIITKTGDIVHVAANIVEERDATIEFRISYLSEVEDEVVAMFKEWEYFTKVDKSFKEKIDGIMRIAKADSFPEGFGQIN